MGPSHLFYGLGICVFRDEICGAALACSEIVPFTKGFLVIQFAIIVFYEGGFDRYVILLFGVRVD